MRLGGMMTEEGRAKSMEIAHAEMAAIMADGAEPSGGLDDGWLVDVLAANSDVPVDADKLVEIRRRMQG